MTDETISAMFAVVTDLLNANIAMADALSRQMAAATCGGRREREQAVIGQNRRVGQASDYIAHARQIAVSAGLIERGEEDGPCASRPSD